MVIIGSGPSDMQIDASGTFLYVGHEQTQAIAQVSLAPFALSQFLVTWGDSYQVAPLAGHRLATIGLDQFQASKLMDTDTGAVLDSGAGGFQPAISAAADGQTLFVGESAIFGGILSSYDVSSDRFVSKVVSNRGFDNVARALVVVPGTGDVYYGGYLLDGATLSQGVYSIPDAIVSVTPDGHLATSANAVYRVSDGAGLGTFSPASAVQAMSPDGLTLFVATAGGISTVDLGAFSSL
jgi:hypothetical protein